MGEQKSKWVSIGILRVNFERLKKLIVQTGDPSVSEYARIAIRERMNKDIATLEADEF